MISYSLALVATTASRTDQLEWTSYLILTCPGTCIDTVFVLCFLFRISSYRCIIHHESLSALLFFFFSSRYLFPSRTRCDRRYHANPTRIGCLIRRRRSYLCSRRFGEHSALIDVLGIFWLPASPFKWLLKSGFLIQWWCLKDCLIKSSCFMAMCRLRWVMPISGSL